MGKVLGIENRAISTYLRGPACAARPDLINKAGFKVSQAHTGAVALIQRFGSALNLTLHFFCAVHRWRLFTQGQWAAEISLGQSSSLAGLEDSHCMPGWR